MRVRFFAHGERVARAGDGRAGTVKDIEGIRVNVIWDDDDSREWTPVTDLVPGTAPEAVKRG